MEICGTDPHSKNLYLPPEILEHIVKHLDIRGLKMVRLVSKSWNDEACILLMSRAASPRFCTSNKDLYKFRLVHQANGKFSELARPFKDLHLKYSSHSPGRAELYSLASDPALRVSRLNVPRLSMRSLTFVRECAEHLKQLEIQGVAQELLLRLNCSFPALRSFTLKLEGMSMKMVTVIADVVHNAPCLESIVLLLSPGSDNSSEASFIDNPSLLNAIKCIHLPLSIRNVAIIEEVPTAYSNNLSLQLLNTLPQLQLNNLRLKLGISPPKSLGTTKMLMRVLTGSSSSLRSLDLSEIDGLDPNVIEADFPYCPELHVLKFPVSSLLVSQKLNAQIPKLRNLELKRNSHFAPKTLFLNMTPFQSVDSVSFQAVPRALEPNVASSLMRTFPNARKWGLYLEIVSKFCEHSRGAARTTAIMESITIYDFVSNYNYLRNMEALTGLTQDEREAETLKTAGLKEATPYSGPSLFDFKGLKDLRFNHEDGISDEVIKFCLGRLPRLEAVGFHWNQDLSIDAVTENLRHLKKIYILNCCRGNNGFELEKLFTTMFTVTCGCRHALET